MFKCPDCRSEFTRRDNMSRHWRQMHEKITGAYPPPPPTPPPPPPPPRGMSPSSPEQNKNVVFQHPFTMMISGPTACGKTTMVKDMLQNHTSKIQPDIHRIVWLYKRWQPLYTEIYTSVQPRVEFIKGIPNDLEDDEFFDPEINNLLILDDLFSESGKDKRITDLFTEGSHHRSLSVISVNQNLFGNKDPTQRRNCHYLILYNNPVDKQSIMTLARQMYPGQSDTLLNMFAKATKRPYGYLMVDLKPFTPDNQRLTCYTPEQYVDNWHPIHHVTPPETINKEQVPTNHHSSVGIQTVHIAEETENMDKGQACDDCGQLFESGHDVQRHVKCGWCPERREHRKRNHDEISDSDGEDDSVEDNESFIQLWKRAKEAIENKYEKIYNRFIDDGDQSDDAHEMTEERMQPHNEQAFFNKYTTLIDTYMLPLRNNRLHKKIMARIDTLISKGMNSTSAVKRVLRMHKNSFQDLFDVGMSDEEGEETDSDNDNEEESDSENA